MKTYRQSLGSRGEHLAQRIYKSKGYTIVATNYRCRRGEIDIIARRKNIIVFVEVKTRRGIRFGFPEEAITLRKQQRMHLCTAEFMRSNLFFAAYRIEIHVCTILVTGNRASIRVYIDP